MQLVEGFIDLTHWPVSKKIFLLGFLSVPATSAAVAIFAFSDAVRTSDTSVTAIADLHLVVPVTLSYLAVQVLLTLLAGLAARAARPMRWLAYVYILVNAAFMTALMYLFGTMSSPLVAIFPSILILWTLYFDERVAWFAFVVLLTLILGAHGLETLGLLPYAPAMVARGVDAQLADNWFYPMFGCIVILFAWVFSICLLVLAASRQQARRLHAARAQLERRNRQIRRYVPAQLVEQIATGGYGEAVKPERRKLTIFFSEIDGFIDAAEELGPEELAAVLNEYLSEMVAIADRYAATVNQLIGDGIMIFFGAPHATDDRDHALRAVRMAMAMQQRVREMHAAWSARGLAQPFQVRMGINTGYASVGDFGSEGRKLYTGIGTQTNLAARIQACCEPGSVLASHATWALIRDEVRCTPRGEIQVKGVHFPLRVYEVTAVPPP